MQTFTFVATQAVTNTPLPGASVSVYLTGTTTFASLFNSSGSPITNPMTADFTGYAVFQVADGTYDIISSSGPYTAPNRIQVQIFDLANFSTEIAGSSGGSYGFLTLAAMNADLTPVAGSTAVVFSDPSPANDGTYVKLGASGSGSWTLGSALTLTGVNSALTAEVARAEAAEAAITGATAVLGPSLGFFAGEPVTAMTRDVNNNVVALSTRTQDFRRGVSGLSPVGPPLLQLEAPTTGTYTGVGTPDNNIIHIVLFMGQSNQEATGNPLDPLSNAPTPAAMTPIYPSNALMLSPAVRLRVRNYTTDLMPPLTPISTTLTSLVEAADSANQTYETAASGCINQIISQMYSATYGPVTSINANSTWTTSSTTISMYESNPQSVTAGMQVVDSTTGYTIGNVLSYVGNVLTLTAAAAFASSGSTDTLQFYAGTFITVAGLVAAHGSYSIAQLKRGTPVYNWGMRGLRDMCGAILALGKRPIVIAVDYNQTETDTSIGTDPQQYAQSLVGLVRSLNSDIKSITGQTQDVIVVATAPQFPEASSGFQNIILAQDMAAKVEPRFVLGPPAYNLRRADSASISAASSWTTGTTITMGSANPGWIIAGTDVYDLTNQQWVGLVASYSGTALTLSSGAAHASAGSSDTLVFQGVNSIHYSSSGRDTYGIALGNVIVQEVFGPGYQPMIPTEVYFSASNVITIRWPYPVYIDTSGAEVVSYGLPSGGVAGLYFDDFSGSPPTIASHTEVGQIQTLTLSGTPTGPHWVLRYGTQCNGGVAQGNWNDFGPFTGARGWIRAAGSGITNFYESFYPVYNWARPFIWKFK